MVEIFAGLIKQGVFRQDVQDGVVKRQVSIVLPEIYQGSKGNDNILKFERNEFEAVKFDFKSPHYFWLKTIKENMLDELGNLKTGDARFATEDAPVLTPCGGSISFINDSDTKKKYVAMAQKDMGASRDPGFRVSRNGFSSNIGDWVSMNHIYRESFEEGLFLTKDYKLLLPENNKYDNIIYSVLENLQKKTNIRVNGEKRIPITFEDLNDKLIITDIATKTKHTYGGAISWTPETGFNLIKKMIVNYPLDDLLFVDGETFPNGDPIKRDYCVIDLDVLQGKRFMDDISETVYNHTEDGKIEISQRDDLYKTDKVPRSVFSQVLHKGKPIQKEDWMLESFRVMSHPKMLSKASSVGYSSEEATLYQKGILHKAI